MALIEKFHVVASEMDVLTGETIKEGMVVSLTTSSDVTKVVKQRAAYPTPFGIAGDTKSTSASAMPGVDTGWQNRVSDYYDETKASGKMTVYHSGGEFATDQFNANVASATILTALYAYEGLLDTTNAQSDIIVGYLTKLDGSYPSGVPGTDINGDMALSGDNTNTYIEFKLVI